ncbi:MAG: hypothetical protein IH605_00190 [Burkholderiales bacterium]|nr:hypothetical protein [Burkholderiales bacterium]
MSTNLPLGEEIDRLQKVNDDLLVALIAIVDLIPDTDSKKSSKDWWCADSFMQAKEKARAAIARAILNASPPRKHLSN